MALLGFVAVERRRRRPPGAPLASSAHAQFSGVNLVTLAVYGGMAGMFFLLVVYLQQVAGYPPIEAGARCCP